MVLFYGKVKMEKNRGLQITSAVNFKAGWTTLMVEYFNFYKLVPGKEQLEAVFNNICSGEVKSLVAIIDDEVIGTTNFLYHPHTFAGKVCYVNDLIVAEKVRRTGVATQLFAKISEEAAKNGCTKVYWNTAADNPARALYNKVGSMTPWVRYEISPLPSKL